MKNGILAYLSKKVVFLAIGIVANCNMVRADFASPSEFFDLLVDYQWACAAAADDCDEGEDGGICERCKLHALKEAYKFNPQAVDELLIINLIF